MGAKGSVPHLPSIPSCISLERGATMVQTRLLGRCKEWQTVYMFIAQMEDFVNKGSVSSEMTQVLLENLQPLNKLADNHCTKIPD